MKKILLTLLLLTIGLAQAQGPTLPNAQYNITTTNTLKIKTPATVTSINYLSTIEVDGSIAKIAPVSLPFLTKVSTVTPNPQVYVKRTDGNQGMLDYVSSTQINDSGVVGISGADALNTLNTGLVYKKTIAQIRALSGTLPSNNFYTTDLGKEGNWYYDSADTTSADNTGTILVTADGKRIKRVNTGIFNVKWFGAKGDGVTDDTAVIQNVINYVYNNKGGNIYFPIGIYIVGGALVNTDNTGKNPNSQLYIPSGKDVSGGGTATAVSIRFLGEVPPSINASGFTDDKIDLMTKGVMIKSTLPYASISGTLPSVFGGKGDNGAYPFNVIDITFENIWIRTHHDPTHGTYMTALNGSQWAFTTFNRVRVDIDVAGWNTVESDNLNFGILGVASSGGTTNVFDNTISYGYRVGYSFGEHAVLNNPAAYFCTWGFDVQKAGHSSTIYHAISQWNKHSFSFNKFDRGYGNTLHFINNYGMVIENLDEGKWFDALADIDDPTSGISGNMFFSKTISGGGGAADGLPITKIGALNLNCKHIARYIATFEKDRSLLVDITPDPSKQVAQVTKGSGSYVAQELYANGITQGNQIQFGQLSTGEGFWANVGNKALQMYTNGLNRLEVLNTGVVKINNLAGTGTRMTLSQSDGTQIAGDAAPTSGTYTPVFFGSVGIAGVPTVISSSFSKVGTFYTVKLAINVVSDASSGIRVLEISLPASAVNNSSVVATGAALSSTSVVSVFGNGAAGVSKVNLNYYPAPSTSHTINLVVNYNIP